MSMLTPQGVAQRRSRPALRRVVSVLVVLVVLAAGSFAAWWFLVREAPAATARKDCPPAAPAAAPAKLPPPAAARTVKLNVYNATTRSGLAASVSGTFAQRGFRVASVANDPAKRRIAAAAEIRHGPKGAGGARTVAAHVDGDVVLLPDRRPDASVDLVLGASWAKARTPAAALAALKAPAAPKPAPRPPGC
jgi:hypothetical protein